MKIYGGKRKIGDDYLEVKFTEYSGDGDIIREGTEDFSQERYSRVPVYEIWTWDGQRTNKGGKRWFEHAQTIRSTGKPAEIRAAYIKSRSTWGGSIPAEISIRKV